MDVAALRDRIQSTLDPNADIRRQAELDLKYVRRGGTKGLSGGHTDFEIFLGNF